MANLVIESTDPQLSTQKEKTRSRLNLAPAERMIPPEGQNNNQKNLHSALLRRDRPLYTENMSPP